MTKVQEILQQQKSTHSMQALQRKSTGHVDQVQDRMKIVGASGVWNFDFSVRDRVGYWLENWVSYDPKIFYYGLAWSTLLICLTLGTFWYLCEEHADDWTFSESVFYAFQIMSVGGHDRTISGGWPTVVFVIMVACGLTMMAVLIGMITESFQLYMTRLSEGRTNAVLAGHTLILGWNETTPRAVVQIARLRNLWHEQNRTILRRVFRWGRLPPSTPVASAPVVIFTDRASKSAIQDAIQAALNDNGVCAKDTRIGAGIVCRIGDPTNPQDLKRVGAQQATSILVMMTDADTEECELSDGRVRQGATLRTLLALRAVVCSAPKVMKGEDTRVIVQLASPSKAIDVIDLGVAFDCRPILQPVDLSNFMNSILFGCVSQPGLGYALLDLLGFEGAALRSRNASEFPEKLIGKKVKDISLKWENAIFAGVASIGLAPPGDYEIQEDDRIIFVSESSLPELSSELEVEPSDGADKGRNAPALEKRVVLICGWRPEWEDPLAFSERLHHLARHSPMGSQLIFLNMKGMASTGAGGESSSVAAFMESVVRSNAAGTLRVDDADQQRWTIGRGVMVHFIAGDAADYKTLESVVKKYDLNQAIIVPSVATQKLSPQMRDTRLMSILTQLRHLQLKHSRDAIHVIGENALDSTGVLAIGPTVGKAGTKITKVPDLVNTHVIYAAALVQALAYPRMFYSISELLFLDDDTANLCMIRATHFIAEGSHTFLLLARWVRHRYPDDILLGIRKVSGRMEMAPSLSTIIDVQEGDFLMVITRRPLDRGVDSDMSTGGALGRSYETMI